jgi:tryptophanyl-tRNA synthetase
MAKIRRITGLQPSGTLHIGNYYGAIKPFVDEYRNYDSLMMVVDYHALTSLKDPVLMRANIQSAVRDYVAAGLDPKELVLFKQSDVSEHTELAWILDCLVSVPFLMQGHAYKDKVAKGLEANAGLFTYPMLMAADILLYDSELVPVGEDQRQHVEYAREAATKFNSTFGNTFKEPREQISKSLGVVPGTDGAKMSKSYGNTIPLFGTKDEIAKAVMSIVTDSSGDIPTNVFAIHKLYRSEAELSSLYTEHKGKYKALKEALIEDIDAVAAPMRQRRESITDDDVKSILKEGGEKARAIASAKMVDVRQKIGVAL